MLTFLRTFLPGARNSAKNKKDFIQKINLGRILGPSGVRAGRIAERVGSVWGLGGGWVSHVTAALLLGTREGASVRGGDLASLGSSAPLGSAGDVDALIDRAVQAVAAAHGVSVSKPSAGGGAGGAVVDSAALDAFAASVTGQQGVLATTARHVLAALGLDEPESYDAAAADEAAATRALVEAVDAELGTGWLKFATPVFRAERAVLIDDRWATAREDLATDGHDRASNKPEGQPLKSKNTGPLVEQFRTVLEKHPGDSPADRLEKDIDRCIVSEDEMSDNASTELYNTRDWRWSAGKTR